VKLFIAVWIILLLITAPMVWVNPWPAVMIGLALLALTYLAAIALRRSRL